MDVSRLPGLWFHSHEEDDGDRIVYRSRSYEFPRARAPRESLDIGANGVVAFGRGGPADATTSSAGAWEVHDGVPVLIAPGGSDAYVVESLDDDMLVLRRRTPEEVRDGEEEQG